MNIRYGNTSDANRLAQLGAQTFYDTFSNDNLEEDIRLHLEATYSPDIQLSELDDPNVIYIVAEVDSELVGYAKLHLNSRVDSVQNEKTIEIERIYSAKEYIGKGVGKELMQSCINEARQRECDSIWLGVWEKNPRAIAFYKKWGFRDVGEHIFMLGKDPQRDIIMKLDLIGEEIS